ncbi:RTA1 like protein-domain-containing protein, partial [Macrophomina phaseolina]
YPLYDYRPTKAGAVIFCLLFVATTGFHLWQMIRRRSWFMTALVVGGAMEFIGYACRAASASQPFNQYTLMPFAIQNSNMLLAPSLFAASIYMVLGRIIQLTDGESRSPITRRLLTKAFVYGDILCLGVQGGGGGMSTAAVFSSTKGGDTSVLAAPGKALTIFGLVAQLIAFAGFIGTAAVFQKRMARSPTPASLEADVSQCWRRYMRVLYAASMLIMVRNIVRVVEFCEGLDGYIITHEAFLYFFDALLMFVALVALNVVHPGELGVLLRQRHRSTS